MMVKKLLLPMNLERAEGVSKSFRVHRSTESKIIPKCKTFNSATMLDF